MAPDPRPTSRGTDRARARSLSELLKSFGSDAARLLRQEIALARAEVGEAMRRFAKAASRVAVGAGLGGVGALTLLAGVIVLIGELIGSYWLSALIVGGVLLLAGGAAAFSGVRRLRSVDPAPRATIDSLQTTARWARAEVAEAKASLLGRGGPRAPEHREIARSPAVAIGAGAGAAAPRVERDSGGAGGAAVAHREERGAAGRDSVPETGRAASPQPPPRSQGTMAFLKHVGKEVQEDEVTGHAARLAYYAFMAMPPALMALFGLAGLVGSERFALWLEEQAAMTMPEAVSEGIVGPFIEQVVLQKAPGPFSVGLLLALWGGSAVFAGLIDTLNHAYDIEETRSFIKKRALAIAIMIGGVLLFLGAAAALLIAPALVDALGLGQVGRFVWSVLQWPIAFLFMVAAFWCAYYFLPNRDQSATRWVLVKAAAIAAALWVLATAGFRLYIANFSSYSETYGFLGAFIILLLWLYMTGLVVLVGGELASEMEKRAP